MRPATMRERRKWALQIHHCDVVTPQFVAIMYRVLLVRSIAWRRLEATVTTMRNCLRREIFQKMKQISCQIVGRNGFKGTTANYDLGLSLKEMPPKTFCLHLSVP